MNDRDSSIEKSGSKFNIPKTKKRGKSKKNSEMDDKIKTFGKKVNDFIDQLQETGETVFSVKDVQKQNQSLLDDIEELTRKSNDELEISKELRDKIEFLKKDRVELETKYKEIVQSLEEENARLKSENEKIESKLEILTKDDEDSKQIESTEPIQEMKEVTIINHFHPTHWDKLIDLNEKNALTIPILSALLEMQEAHLIIIALKLEVDHSQCLEVITELENMGIIELKQKIAGGLNPLIKLKQHI